MPNTVRHHNKRRRSGSISSSSSSGSGSTSMNEHLDKRQKPDSASHQSAESRGRLKSDSISNKTDRADQHDSKNADGPASNLRGRDSKPRSPIVSQGSNEKVEPSHSEFEGKGTTETRSKAFQYKLSPPLTYYSKNLTEQSEQIGVMWDPDRVSVEDMKPFEVMAGERPALEMTIKDNKTHEAFLVATTHAPYKKADGTATSYESKLKIKAQEKGIQILMGDMNTYGREKSSAHSNRTEYGFVHLKTGPTSQGGAPLDKVYVTVKLEERATAWGGERPTDSTEESASDTALTIGSWNLQGKAELRPEKLGNTIFAQSEWDVLLTQEPGRMAARPNEKPTRASTRPRTQPEKAPQSDHTPITLRIGPVAANNPGTDGKGGSLEGKKKQKR